MKTTITLFTIYLSVTIWVAYNLVQENERLHNQITTFSCPTINLTEVCVPWLFHSDMISAKRRVCGGKK